MFTQIRFDLFPVAAVVPDLLTVCAHGEQSVQRLDLFQGFLEIRLFVQEFLVFPSQHIAEAVP